MLLRDIKRGDIVWEHGFYYEAVSHPERCIKQYHDGHECQMLGITGPAKGKLIVFFEAINAGGYGLKLEMADASMVERLQKEKQANQSAGQCGEAVE